MKALVLGGCGFIGSHVVDRVLAQGHSVRVFDRQPGRYRPPIPGVEYMFENFSDRMAIIEALAGVDVVIHLISTTFPGTADLDPKADVLDNLAGTLSLLDAMVAMKTRRIVFLSSGGTVYGVPEKLPITETHPLRPINSYGIVKVAIEHYLDMYRRTRGLSTLSVRASNPYGPRQGHTGVQGVVSTFMHRLCLGEPIEIWGDGTVVRDYIYVSDLAEFCARAVASENTGAVNAGTGVGVSIAEIIVELEAITGDKITPVFRPGRTVDVPSSVLDVTRAREDFGWAAVTPLQQGLAETWQWVRNTQT